MYRIGIVLIGFILWSCKGKKGEKEFSYESFAKLFPAAQATYQISDADILANKDTTVIRSAEFAKFISDSVKLKLFGKTGKVKYIALARVKAPGKTNYYIVKAIEGNKRVVLLLPFTNDQFDVAFPLLVPDNDGTTTQTSTIDKSNAIIKSISQKKPGGETSEGRDVYQYVPEAKQFTLLLTSPLNAIAEIINPIDTLPRKNKFSGDYIKDKKNFVSIRDGRNATDLLVFIHIEKGECSGEIKGALLLTSSSKGVYRQSGDPCQLSFQFSGNVVSVKEDGGCGSRRGLDCSFDGAYKKKKEVKTKSSKKRSLSK